MKASSRGEEGAGGGGDVRNEISDLFFLILSGSVAMICSAKLKTFEFSSPEKPNETQIQIRQTFFNTKVVQTVQQSQH